MANSFRMLLELQSNKTGLVQGNSQLIFIIQGSCSINVNDKKHCLNNNDFYFIGSEIKYDFSNCSPDLFICRFIFAPDIGSKLSKVECCSLDAKDEYPIAQMRLTINRLLWEEQSGAAADSSSRMSLYYQLIDIMETYFLNPYAENDVTTEIRQYIYKNFRDEITLDSLAEAFHFSSAYLSRMFKQKFGQNFVSYLNQLRIRQTAEEISSTDSSIMLIAVNNGFSSISSFYKLFKEKYGMQPLDYRRQCREKQNEHHDSSEESQKEQFLREYLKLDECPEIVEGGDYVNIEASVHNIVAEKAELTKLVNLGSLRQVSDQLWQSVNFSKGRLGLKFLRVWSIIPDTVFKGNIKSSDFYKLDHFLEFCQNEGLIPYLELGDVVEFDENMKSLLCYQIADLYKKAIDILITRISAVYSCDLPIYFELQLFDVEEGIPTGLQYFDIYRHLEKRAKTYFQEAKIGGPGIQLLNYIKKEEEIVVPWIKDGIVPDFFSLKIHPYFKETNGHMKAIADPDCMKKAVRRLKNVMSKYNMNEVPVHINYFDSFYHNKCPLNDSLWKASFAMKVYQDCLGYVDLLSCGLLKDMEVPEDMEEQLLAGANGMLCRNGSAKPLFGLLRAFRGFGNQIIHSTPGCIISKVSNQMFKGVIYNYRHLNFLFYANGKTDFSQKDMEMYLAEADNKTFHIKIDGMENGTYQISRYIFTKDRGSILDAWIQRGSYLGPIHSHWLDLFSSPDVMIESVEVIDGKLEIEYVLKPLEFMSIEIKV